MAASFWGSYCKNGRTLKYALAFQVLFFTLQFFVFYPCLVNAPPYNKIDINQAKSWNPVQEVSESRGNVVPAVKIESSGKYQPNWESLESRPLPAWYDEAKIGIFIHWGVYSVPSFLEGGNDGLAAWLWWNWKGTPEKENPIHIKNKESVEKFIKQNYPPGFQYTDFAPQFKAEFFKPDQWAELFNASGARYVVLTSKHHEGFPLWPSKWSWNWNAMDNGPHRDLVGDLAKSVRSKGIKFGLYHSLYEWFNPHYLQDKKNNFTTQIYLKEKLMPELTDIVMKYRPDLVWTDGDWEAPCSYWNCTQFIAWLYNESPIKDTVITNDRWGSDVTCKHGGFWTCEDRYVPENTLTRKWENCMTIDKESWGYRRNADYKDYYTMDELIQTLVETVSKGGNLLMNVGPTADGRIIPLFQERLTQLGQWLKVNGEAIYGTKPWKYFKDPNAEGVWYTSKKMNGKTVVFAIVLDFLKEWNGVIKLSAFVDLTDTNTQINWLGYRGPVEWKSNNGLEIQIPRLFPYELPCEWAWTFKIENIKNT